MPDPAVTELSVEEAESLLTEYVIGEGKKNQHTRRGSAEAVVLDELSRLRSTSLALATELAELAVVREERDRLREALEAMLAPCLLPGVCGRAPRVHCVPCRARAALHPETKETIDVKR